MAATSAFLQTLMEEKAIRKHKTFVGIVGMRVDPRTKAAATLEAFLDAIQAARPDLPARYADLRQCGIQRIEHVRFA